MSRPQEKTTDPAHDTRREEGPSTGQDTLTVVSPYVHDEARGPGDEPVPTQKVASGPTLYVGAAIVAAIVIVLGIVMFGGPATETTSPDAAAPPEVIDAPAGGDPSVTQGATQDDGQAPAE